MSDASREADLRLKVLSVVEEFKEPFASIKFRKAYKQKYGEKFSSRELSARDYLNTFPEITFDEEDDTFEFHRKEVKIEEDPSSPEDEENRVAPEANEEVNESSRAEGKCWYHKEEFHQLLKAVKKELQSNPDLSIAEGDAERVVKLHLLRKLTLGLTGKIFHVCENGGSFFYLGEFLAEWRTTHSAEKFPCAGFGYSSLNLFFKSFPQFDQIGYGKYAIMTAEEISGACADGSSTTPIARKIIDDGKKEAARQLAESKEAAGTEEFKEGYEWSPEEEVEQWYTPEEYKKELDSVKNVLKKCPLPSFTEEDISRAALYYVLREKVIGVVFKIYHVEDGGLFFYRNEFIRENTQSVEYVPCEQFGYDNLHAYLESLPGFRLVSRRRYSIETTKKSGEPEDSTKESKKNGVTATEKFNKNGMDGPAKGEGAKRADEIAVRRKVIALAQKLATYDSAGRLLFDSKKVIKEWRRTEAHFLPFKELGFKNLHAFFKSFPEFQSRAHFMYMLRSSQPESDLVDASSDADEPSAAKDSLKKAVNEAKKIQPREPGQPKKTCGHMEKETDEIESDESDDEEETLKCKDKVQSARNCTPKEVNSGQKKANTQKEAVEAQKKAPVVLCSSSDSDSDSSSDEEIVEKVVKKTKKQPEMQRETVVEPKTGIKEKKKSMEMEKRGRKSTIEDEPRKKAVKRSHSPELIVLDDDEPSLKNPKVEIQDTKETRLVGEEDLAQKAISTHGGVPLHGQGTRMSGGGEMAMGPEGKVLPPLNMMDPSSSFMPPAPGFPMPVVPPLFCPTTQQQLNLSNGGVAALFMAQLLDNAEKKGMDVDAIALEAIQVIKKKMNSEK